MIQQEWYVWSVGGAYVLGALCVLYVLVRHYRSSTAAEAS
jgi:hypothetical protein